MMAKEDLEQLVWDHVRNWLVKAPSNSAARHITEREIERIVSIMKREGQPDREAMHQAFRDEFDGWLVQRARGEYPSLIDHDDFIGLLALLSPEKSEPAPVESSCRETDATIKAEHGNEADPVPEESQSTLSENLQNCPLEQPIQAETQAHEQAATIQTEREEPVNMEFSRFHLDHGV